jgi:hypothetical protein
MNSILWRSRPRWTISFMALLMFFLVGCGSSGNDFVSTNSAGGNATNTLVGGQLARTWGGYFPGSSFQHPETGLELHLDGPVRNGVLHRAGFIHRKNLEGHRHDVQVQQNGNDVVLVFDPGSSDEGRFNGTLIDDHTLRGTYTNASRGEAHSLDLIASTAVPQEIRPIQAKAAESSVRPLASKSGYLTLRLDFVSIYEGFPSIQNTVDFGLGPYYNSGFADSTWRGNNNFNDGEYTWDGGIGANTSQGYSTVSAMFFFPDWLLLDLYARPSDTTGSGHLASFQLPWTSLITLDTSKLGSGSYAYQAFQVTGSNGTFFTSGCCSISNMRLSWETTTDRFDFEDFAVPADNPGYRSVLLGTTVYTIPANAAAMLKSVGFVVTYQQ